MNVPRNVFWFEVLLYLSLMLEALSAAFQDRTPTGEITEQLIATVAVAGGATILLLVYFVWLAAQRRKSWPRWVLLALLLMSVYSLVEAIGDTGLALDGAIDVVSCALSAAGLYCSFTGDAKGWFNA